MNRWRVLDVVLIKKTRNTILMTIIIEILTK